MLEDGFKIIPTKEKEFTNSIFYYLINKHTISPLIQQSLTKQQCIIEFDHKNKISNKPYILIKFPENSIQQTQQYQITKCHYKIESIYYEGNKFQEKYLTPGHLTLHRLNIQSKEFQEFHLYFDSYSNIINISVKNLEGSLKMATKEEREWLLDVTEDYLQFVRNLIIEKEHFWQQLHKKMVEYETDIETYGEINALSKSQIKYKLSRAISYQNEVNLLDEMYHYTDHSVSTFVNPRIEALKKQIECFQTLLSSPSPILASTSSEKSMFTNKIAKNSDKKKFKKTTKDKSKNSDKNNDSLNSTFESELFDLQDPVELENKINKMFLHITNPSEWKTIFSPIFIDCMLYYSKNYNLDAVKILYSTFPDTLDFSCIYAQFIQSMAINTLKDENQKKARIDIAIFLFQKSALYRSIFFTTITTYKRYCSEWQAELGILAELFIRNDFETFKLFVEQGFPMEIIQVHQKVQYDARGKLILDNSSNVYKALEPTTEEYIPFTIKEFVRVQHYIVYVKECKKQSSFINTLTNFSYFDRCLQQRKHIEHALEDTGNFLFFLDPSDLGMLLSADPSKLKDTGISFTKWRRLTQKINNSESQQNTEEYWVNLKMRTVNGLKNIYSSFGMAAIILSMALVHANRNEDEPSISDYVKNTLYFATVLLLLSHLPRAFNGQRPLVDRFFPPAPPIQKENTPETLLFKKYN